MPEDSQSKISTWKHKVMISKVIFSPPEIKAETFVSDEHLKAVEFSIAEDAVVVLVRNVEYSGEGSDTRRFQLEENIKPY